MRPLMTRNHGIRNHGIDQVFYAYLHLAPGHHQSKLFVHVICNLTKKLQNVLNCNSKVYLKRDTKRVADIMSTFLCRYTCVKLLIMFIISNNYP